MLTAMHKTIAAALLALAACGSTPDGDMPDADPNAPAPDADPGHLAGTWTLVDDFLINGVCSFAEGLVAGDGFHVTPDLMTVTWVDGGIGVHDLVTGNAGWSGSGGREWLIVQVELDAPELGETGMHVHFQAEDNGFTVADIRIENDAQETCGARSDVPMRWVPE